jgi:hypothetical protein
MDDVHQTTDALWPLSHNRHWCNNYFATGVFMSKRLAAI